MSPPLLLALLVAITAGAFIIDQRRRAHRRAILRTLARQWKMHFAATDPFNLAPRVAAMFPVPGAASLQVYDVIYALQQDRHRYIFTAEFTQGVLRQHLRVRMAATFCESRDGTGDFSPVRLAKNTGPLSSQYKQLQEQETPEPITGS